MKTPRILALLAGCTTVALVAQIIVSPDPAVGIVHQDPGVKILGDVAHGPPLAPIVSTGGPVVFPPWGPRSYPSSGKFLNHSFRGWVGTGNQVAIGGFVVSEGDRVLMIRAVGPTLASYNLPGVLARPQLELFDAAGKSLATAVPWSATSTDTQNEIKKAALAVGAFALLEGSEDQVLLLLLKRGSYTFVVSGVGGATGMVLLETYEIPQAPGALPGS